MDVALPNLHPAVVHFPIVLVPLAFVLDGLGFVRPTLRRAAAWAWGLAAVGAAAAVVAGRIAADGLVDPPPQAQPHIGSHSDWATATLALTVAVAVLRGIAEVRPKAAWSGGLRALGLVAGAAAGVVLFVTADKGGALVYRHALAVAVPECPSCEAPPPDVPSEEAPPAGRPELLQGEDGVYVWAPRAGDLDGIGATPWPSRGVAVAVDGALEIPFDGPFGDVQVNAWLDLGGFDGVVSLEHHQGDDGGGALVLATSGRARLVDGGEVLDEASAPLSGRHAVAVNAAGSHLKGLVDGKTVVHGHAPARAPGAVVLRFEGTGVVAIERVEVVPL